MVTLNFSDAARRYPTPTQPHSGRKASVTATFADRLRRLQRMDAALATAAGLNVPAFAAAEGVHRKTIDRDLTVLQQCGLRITTDRDPKTGRYHRWSDRRLFAE